MNILLWILQILLAVHTIMGAVWKFSNSEQTVTSLKSIPHGAWLSLSIIELACAIGLLIPLLSKKLGMLAPTAALIIATEMILFCVIHFISGSSNYSQPMYWLVVTVICIFIAYGRFVLKPL